MAPDDRLRIEITSTEQLRSWLDRHHGQEHGQEHGVWLVTYKKHRPEPSVGRVEVLDELRPRLDRRRAASGERIAGL